MLSLININDHRYNYCGNITNKYGETIHISYYMNELYPPKIEYVLRIYTNYDLYERKFTENNNIFEKKIQTLFDKMNFTITGTISPIQSVYFDGGLMIPFVCNLREEHGKITDYFFKLKNELRGDN